MSAKRPTLQEILTRITDDINSRFDGPDLRRTSNHILSRVLAGEFHLTYGLLEYIGKQVNIYTADSEHLDSWANTWRLSRKPATFATGRATIKGNVNSSIPEDTILSSSNGLEYQIVGSHILTTPEIIVDVICLTSGIEGNLASNETLTLQTPLVGVESGVTLSAEGITGGEPQETDDSLRERILTVIQNPPRGGTVNDYKIWASSIEEVGRVYVTPLITGPGTVGVSFLTNDPDNIIPNAVKIQEVQDYIDSQSPLTASVTVFAPTTVPLDIEIANLTPDTPEVRETVTNELHDVILREAQPGGTILLSHLREAASIATGENDHSIITPNTNITSALDEILIPGEVQFV